MEVNFSPNDISFSSEIFNCFIKELIWLSLIKTSEKIKDKKIPLKYFKNLISSGKFRFFEILVLLKHKFSFLVLNWITNVSL